MEMERFPTCVLCGQTGRVRYADLADRLWGVPGLFQLRECLRCRLLWLDPRPRPEHISACYRDYYTHDVPVAYDEPARPFAGLRDRLREAILCGYFGYRILHTKHGLCRIGGLLGHIPLLRYRAVYSDFGDRFPAWTDRRDNLLVDVGCGRGDFLARMKSLGWNVLGIEPDPVAAALAERRGIPVFCGSLSEAALPDSVADQVLMHHVLEHTPDPWTMIDESFRILRPGGQLLIVTPNNDSLGHRFFKENWRGLEPPRHLFVYSGSSMKKILEKSFFKRFQVTTRVNLARGILDYGMSIRKGGSTAARDASPQTGRALFGILESLLCSLGQPAGEEIVAVAHRDAGPSPMHGNPESACPSFSSFFMT